ncbi:hypothetical protein POJ06DRAFT_259138 [Lipomyces tetrasporus]|uniref:Uncharacterized protein n=1 Tax=Lipomyces tetrasporus TaxID=54092 RepID=A0AAD7QN48_9ASCO|nr:uncharacterized protein POJ06DRAFT_259138 [Lipomyces tetrasporus]KAJ8098314.1 hypothetical protein POJ06DRAFT_259138 [Lipomyces tetrasporus]
MPVTRSASANVGSSQTSAATPIGLTTPKSKGRLKKAKAVKRTSLIESLSIGNLSQPRIDPVVESKSATTDSEPTTTCVEKSVKTSVIDVALLNASEEMVKPRSYDKECDSDDSFERSIVWSAKKAKHLKTVVPVNRQGKPPKGNDTKITYSPVLASILAKGLDSVESWTIESEKPIHITNNSKLPSKRAHAVQCSQIEVSATEVSSAQSIKLEVDQNGRIRRSQGDDSIRKELKKEPWTLASTTPSNITKQLRQQRRAESMTRQQRESAPENKAQMTVASETKKSNFRSPGKTTEPVPFSFATDARLKSERKVSASYSHSVTETDSGFSIVSTSVPTHLTLQKKRSALLEREKVVKKSLSNLSLRSQYSGKFDMNDHSNRPQASSRYVPTEGTSAAENTVRLSGTKPASSTASLTNAGKGVRKSGFISLSFYRSKRDLSKTTTESVVSDTSRGTVSIIPSTSSAAVKEEPVVTGRSIANFSIESSSGQVSLANGMQALNTQPTQETITHTRQMTEVEKLRLAASEQGRRTVELWAMRQQQAFPAR